MRREKCSAICSPCYGTAPQDFTWNWRGEPSCLSVPLSQMPEPDCSDVSFPASLCIANQMPGVIPMHEPHLILHLLVGPVAPLPTRLLTQTRYWSTIVRGTNLFHEL